MNADLQFLNRLRKLSENCRGYRIGKRLSTLDLSVKSGVSEKTIYNIEASSGNVTIKILINISTALEISLEDLLR